MASTKLHKPTSLLLRLIVTLSCLAGPSAFAAVCDVDSDGDIDSRDIFVIQVPNIGRQATSPNDPKDADRNGIITNADVNICKKRCTLSGCQIPPNKAPKAIKDSASTARNSAITINLTANDRDRDGRIVARTVRITAKPKNGRVRNLKNGTVAYTPASGFLGRDSFKYTVKDNRGAKSNQANVSVTVKSGNLPPIANAGADLNARVGLAVTLNGSQSSDPERAPLAFSWTFQSVPAASALSNAALANAQSAAPNFIPDVEGVYELALSVSDGVHTNVDTVLVTATSANVPPNVNAGADKTALTGTTVTLTGSATDPDNGPAALTYRWFFTPPLPTGSTLSDANIGNSNTTTATFTPDVAGAYRLGLEANDGIAKSQDEVIVTTALTTPPTANAGLDIVVPLGDLVNLNGSASALGTGPGPLTFQWRFAGTPPSGSALTDGSIAGPTTATPSFTPDVLGNYLLGLEVSDGVLPGQDQVQVKANVAPIANPESYTTVRGIPLNITEAGVPPGVLTNDTDGNSDPLTAVIDTPPANGLLTLNADGSFTYTPAATPIPGFVGSDSFTYHANDGSVNGNPPVPVANANSSPATVTITVNPPNEAPSFTKGADPITVNEDAGAQSVAWATNISQCQAFPCGLTSEASQTVSFNITGNTNAALFSVAPTVSPTGVLAYTPAPDANGSATITIELKDTGGTVGGGVDTSASQTLTINVTAVNDAPSFTKGADQTVDEDAGAQTVPGWATAISSGPADESAQTLTFNVIGNTNAALFSAGPVIAPNGTLTYTPAANANGSATVTVALQDTGGTANGGADTSPPQTFTITVTAIDDAPSFTIGPNQAIPEDAGAQNIPGWATSITDGDPELSQALAFNLSPISTDNPALFSVAPSVDPLTGNLAYTPAANASGTATFSLTLTDGTNTSAAQSLTITVTAVNDAPTANPDSIVVDEGGTATLLASTAGSVSTNDTDLDNLLGVLTVTVVTPPTQASSFTLNTDGTFSYTHNGSETTTDSFVYEICDLEPLCSTATVSITINPNNDDPVISNLGGDSLTYFQAEPARVIDQNNDATATDVDSTNFDTGTLTVSFDEGVPAEDQLGIRNLGTAAGQISVSGANIAYNPLANTGAVPIGTFTGGGAGGADLVITLNASATQEATSALLRNITYLDSNTATPDTTTIRVASFVLTDGDGGTSIAYTATINVAPNAPPVLTASGATPSFTENGVAAIVDGGITVTDSNDTNLESATVTITNPQNGAAEALAASACAGLTVTPGLNNLSISGSQPIATYQTCLRSVSYSNSSENPGTTARSIAFVVNDGSVNSNTATKTLTVNSVNDQPSFTAANPPTTNEDAAAQTVTGWATFNPGHPDESAQTVVAYNVTNVSNTALFAVGGQPTVNASGNLVYVPAPNAFGTSTFQVTVQDNGGTANGGVDTSLAQTFTITVNAVNDVPSFTATNPPAVSEDAGAQTVSAWAAFNPGNTLESIQTVSAYIVSNVSNAGLFSGQPTVNASGVLSYTPAPNANGTSTFQVAVQDNGGTTNGGVDTSAAQTFTITVNAVNDAPVVTPPAAYSAHTHMKIVGLSGLLAGVTDADSGINGCTPTFNIVGIANQTGGTFTNLNATAGTFDFEPNQNFTGTATATYTVQDTGCPGVATSTSATISINVSGPKIWFVNSAASPGGNGTLSQPFQSLGAVDAVDNPNDRIFVFTGTYTTSFVLLSGEELIGQGATGTTFDALFGISPPTGTVARPAINGTRPSVQNTIMLANSGVVRGLNIATSNVSALTDPVGATTGVSVTEVDVSATTATAVSFNDLTGTVTLGNTTSTAGTNNVSLTNVGATVNLGGGALSGSTGTAFDVTGGTGVVSYAGTINKTNIAQRPVSVANKTSGSVTFTGGITANSGATLPLGISLTNNTGSTVNFQGGVALSTGANPALTATGGGTVNVTGAANTLTTTTGTALNVANTTIGASGLTFQSISSNGGTNGIVLNTTGSTGGLTVTGTGSTDGTGGTIQNTTNRGASFISASNINLKNMNFTNAGSSDLDATNGGLSTGDNLATNAAIHLQSVTNATLDNLNITNSAEQGINGHNVNGFTLSNSVLSGLGNGPDEDGLHFYNMVGTCAISNNSITSSGDDNVNIQNNTTPIAPPTSVGTITVTGGNFDTGSGGSGLLFGIRGTSNTTINISGVTLDNNFSGGIVADSFDTATMKLDVTGITDRNNNDGIQVSGHNGSAQFDIHDFNDNAPTSGVGIYNNDFLGIFMLKSAFSTTGRLEGQITNTEVTIADQRTTDAIFMFGAGGSDFRTAITNNDIDYRGTQRPITVNGGQDGAALIDTTITGNDIDLQLDGTNNAIGGIITQVIIATPGGNGSTLCSDIGGAGGLSNLFAHTISPVALAAGDIRVRQRNGGPVRLPGYTGAGNDTAAIVAYLDGRNGEVSTSTATDDTTDAVVFSGGAACNAPVIP